MKKHNISIPLIFLSFCLTLSISSDAEEAEIETVLVTGERIVRSQKETAASVSITSQQNLDDFAGADTLSRIFEQTANVSSSGEGNQGPTIRGANTSGVLTSLESFFGGSQPRTTVQVDGRQLTFSEYVYSGESAWDIRQVEIFRGPQTTSQGRNAIAGSVYIETANPNHDEFEGRIRGIIGDSDTTQLSAVISGPIGDGQVAYRISVDERKTDIELTPLGADQPLGVDLVRSETQNIRGKLSYRPANTEAFDAQLTFTHSDTSRPQTDSVDAPFELRERFNPGFSVFQTKSDAGVLALNYELSDSVVLKSKTTYSDVSVQRLAPLGTGNADIQSDDLTTELIVYLNSSDDPFYALFGTYLSDLDSSETLDLSAFGIGSGAFEDQRTSAGLFAEGTWSIGEQLHLTAGARWQRDSQDRDGGFSGVIPIDFDESFDEFLPKFELAYDLNQQIRIGVVAEKGFNAGGFTFNFNTFSAETFNEETVWNYELFLRGDFFDGRLNVSSNIFYSDFDDLQIATLVELGPEFFANVFSNVDQSSSYGLEIDTRFQVSGSLSLQAGLGLSNSEFNSNSDAGALIDGNEFQRAAGLTAVAGLLWEPNERVSVSAFGRYSDGYFSDDSNTPANAVGDYITADLQASYNLGSLRFFVEVTNAFDTNYEVSIFDNGELASLGTSRRASFGIDYRF